MAEKKSSKLDGIINAVSQIADNVSAQISKLIGNITDSLSTDNGLPENVIAVEKKILGKPDLLKLASDYLQKGADGIVMQIDEHNNTVWVSYAKSDRLLENNVVLKVSAQKIADDILILFDGNETICLTK